MHHRSISFFPELGDTYIGIQYIFCLIFFSPFIRAFTHSHSFCLSHFAYECDLFETGFERNAHLYYMQFFDFHSVFCSVEPLPSIIVFVDLICMYASVFSFFLLNYCKRADKMCRFVPQNKYVKMGFTSQLALSSNYPQENTLAQFNGLIVSIFIINLALIVNHLMRSF